MPIWLAVLNTLAALSSAGIAAAAVLRPTTIAPTSEGNPPRFFVHMYAARSLPLGVAVAIIVWLPQATVAAVLLVAVATLAQLFDVFTARSFRIRGMIIGASFGVLCHGAGALALALAV